MPGEAIVNSLTREQTALLLEVLLTERESDQYKKELREADAEMGETVAEALGLIHETNIEVETIRLASEKRDLERWLSQGERWDEIVAGIGDGEGPHAIREAPGFDMVSLADDLESAAERMLLLMINVFERIDAPELFASALDELARKVSSHPQWKGAKKGGGPLGKNVTRCALLWRWLALREDASPGTRFTETVLKSGIDIAPLRLDSAAIIDFFEELPNDVCREIHSLFKKNSLGFELENPHSVWSAIYLDYDGRFNTDRFREWREERLSEHWRHGIALIDDAMDKGSYKEAESLLMETFKRYTREADGMEWRPETSLLIEKRWEASEYDKAEMLMLLEKWFSVAGHLDNAERKAALRFQSVVCVDPENWGAVAGEYVHERRGDMKRAMAPLFERWKNLIARLSRPSVMDECVVEETWIHWLIDAVLDPGERRERLLEKLKSWLAGLLDDGAAFEKQFHWLWTLTLDLPGCETLEKDYPAFYSWLLFGGPLEGAALARHRRESLKIMNTGSCLPLAMAIWKKHLRRVIPDPSRARKADYSYHVRWAGVLCELNPTAFDALMDEWRTHHARRRNLWRDLKALDPPIPGMR